MWVSLGAMTASKEAIYGDRRRVDYSGPIGSSTYTLFIIQCSCGAGAGELDSRRILGPLGIGIDIGEDKRPSLQIQALPASPEVLMGKPTLRG